MNFLYQYKAKVVDIYDGDTFTLDIDTGFDIHKIEKIRLARIDTPELRGEEKEQGKFVRDHVKQLVLGKEIIIHTDKDKKGKYGRYIAEVYYQGPSGDYINLNDYLLDKGMATLY